MLIFVLFASISLALALASPVNNVYSLEDGRELFEDFIKEHNKQYEGTEKEERFQIFLENLKDINLLNEKSSNTVFGISKFADLTKDEFKQTYTGFIPNENLTNRKSEDRLIKRFNYTAPDEFDWRSKGVVSRVKDQGPCLSCWAFSASGNVESINAIKTGRIVEISEQQLVDCDSDSDGCKGGYPEKAISYLVQNGAMSEDSYPYQIYDGSCRFNSSKVVVHVAKSKFLPLHEADIKEMLYTTGPLSIVVDAGPLQKYTGNILTVGCPSKNIDHAVLLVGYGQENGVDYWIVKNSWGEFWAENGYFRMQRGVNCLNINQYGVATAVI